MYLYIYSQSCAGSYSDSSGIEIIRKHVAEFISRRDGVPCDFKNVYLVNGASDGIKTMLFMVTGGTQGSDTKAGVLLPIPVFPLYNAALTELGAYMVLLISYHTLYMYIVAPYPFSVNHGEPCVTLC